MELSLINFIKLDFGQNNNTNYIILPEHDGFNTFILFIL